MKILQQQFKELLFERFELELEDLGMTEDDIEDFVSLFAVEAELDRLKLKHGFRDKRDLDPS
jgi:hypothetical protein